MLSREYLTAKTRAWVQKSNTEDRLLYSVSSKTIRQCLKPNLGACWKIIWPSNQAWQVSETTLDPLETHYPVTKPSVWVERHPSDSPSVENCPRTPCRETRGDPTSWSRNRTSYLSGTAGSPPRTQQPDTSHTLLDKLEVGRSSSGAKDKSSTKTLYQRSEGRAIQNDKEKEQNALSGPKPTPYKYRRQQHRKNWKLHTWNLWNNSIWSKELQKV